MKFQSYKLNEEGHDCIVFYTVNDSILNIRMYKEDDTRSMVQKLDGELKEHVLIKSKNIEVPVWELANEEGEKSYVTQFEFEEGYYFIPQ